METEYRNRSSTSSRVRSAGVFAQSLGVLLRVGCADRMAPNRVCSAVSLVKQFVIDKEEAPRERWPIIARGANS